MGDDQASQGPAPCSLGLVPAFTALHCDSNGPGSFPTSLSQQSDVYTQGCYTNPTPLDKQ